MIHYFINIHLIWQNPRISSKFSLIINESIRVEHLWVVPVVSVMVQSPDMRSKNSASWDDEVHWGTWWAGILKKKSLKAEICPIRFFVYQNPCLGVAKSLSWAVTKYHVGVGWAVTKYWVEVGWAVKKYQVEVGWTVTKYPVGVGWAVTKYWVGVVWAVTKYWVGVGWAVTKYWVNNYHLIGGDTKV